MKSSILIDGGKSQIIDKPIPKINSEEVLIKVLVCGVCASELPIWNSNEFAGRTFGHEPVGIIVEIGKNVHGFKVGDRVTGLIQEAFAEYTKANYRHIVHVPEALKDEEAIGEPLSCLMSGASRTPISFGDTAAIIGTGFMGLGFMQLLKIKGASKIIAIDTREEGLENAMKFGADLTRFPNDVENSYKVLEWEHMHLGVDVAVETSGSQAGLNLAEEMTTAHGVLSIVGYHQSNEGLRQLNMKRCNWKAITIINAHERRDHVHTEMMKSGLKMIERKQFNMKDMITHVFSLDEVDQAYNALINKPEGFIKSVVRVSQ